MPSTITLDLPPGKSLDAIARALKTGSGPDPDGRSVGGSLSDHALRLRASGPAILGGLPAFGPRRTFVGDIHGLGDTSVVIGSMRRSRISVFLVIVVGLFALTMLDGSLGPGGGGSIEVAAVAFGWVVLVALTTNELLERSIAAADQRSIEYFLRTAISRASPSSGDPEPAS